LLWWENDHCDRTVQLQWPLQRRTWMTFGLDQEALFAKSDKTRFVINHEADKSLFLERLGINPISKNAVWDSGPNSTRLSLSGIGFRRFTCLWQTRLNSFNHHQLAFHRLELFGNVRKCWVSAEISDGGGNRSKQYQRGPDAGTVWKCCKVQYLNTQCCKCLISLRIRNNTEQNISWIELWHRWVSSRISCCLGLTSHCTQCQLETEAALAIASLEPLSIVPNQPLRWQVAIRLAFWALSARPESWGSLDSLSHFRNPSLPSQTLELSLRFLAHSDRPFPLCGPGRFWYDSIPQLFNWRKQNNRMRDPQLD
jgi:hypothetical protein